MKNWIETAKGWCATMLKDTGWTYSNANNKTNWADARKKDNRYTNCALMVTHALQIAGYFTTSMKMYGKRDGTISANALTKKRLAEIANITHYEDGKVTIKDLDIQPGDIVTYYIQHTNIYVGNGKWLDAGRGTNVNHAVGGTWKSFNSNGCTAYVSNVIRLKNDIAEPKYADGPATKNESTDVADKSGMDGFAASFDKGVAGTYTVKSKLNLRRGASTEYDIKAVMQKGAVFTCYGYFSDVDGKRWMYGVYNCIAGFCDSKYLKKK